MSWPNEHVSSFMNAQELDGKTMYALLGYLKSEILFNMKMCKVGKSVLCVVLMTGHHIFDI